MSALALLSVLILAGFSIYFADRTRTAAQLLMENGIVGSNLASRLDLLLQQHKGLVRSAPAELDREQLTVTRNAMRTLNRQIVLEIEQGRSSLGVQNVSWTTLAKQLSAQMPTLFDAGERVVDLAYNFVQDQSLEVSQSSYTPIAELTLGQIATWSNAQRRVVNNQVQGLFADSDTLVAWVYGSILTTFLIGSLGFITAADVLHRLRQIKHTMLRLADRDDSIEIPFLEKTDEIGAMARAVQVFKQNAAQISAQETELRQTNLRFAAALSNMCQGLCLYDASGRLDVFNKQFTTILGVENDRIRVGLTLREVLQLSLEAGNYPGRSIEDVVAERQAFVERQEAGVTLHALSGGRTMAISHCPMPQGGWVATYEDVTARRTAEAKVAYMARHDALTGLPNRLVMTERLDQALAQAGRESSSAILCLDLDRFKTVNDTLGHPVGDGLLRAVSERLLACVREGDTVVRLGGDEFAIVQAGINRPEKARLLAERINRSISVPFLIDGHHVEVGISVGVALVPGDGTSSAVLLKNADIALYRAKSDGRGTFCFFEPDMDARLQNRLQLEVDLRKGILAEEFELFYQPLVNLENDRVSGFEALLRWNHPERGMVSPAEFIPIAEDVGLIIPIGEWAIQRACVEASTWPDGTKVAVNLSPIQFRSKNLVSSVARSLAISGLSAHRLELEITESVLLQDNASTLTTLHELHALGLRISMDDFGTGYSSLSYLRSFPFDKIKIDQSFIRDLCTRDGSVHIVRAVHGLCAGLGMMMTAEGVETEEQLSILRSEGCMEIQGFLFSKPLPARDIPSIIRRVRERAKERSLLPSKSLLMLS